MREFHIARPRPGAWGLVRPKHTAPVEILLLTELIRGLHCGTTIMILQRALLICTAVPVCAALAACSVDVPNDPETDTGGSTSASGAASAGTSANGLGGANAMAGGVGVGTAGALSASGAASGGTSAAGAGTGAGGASVAGTGSGGAASGGSTAVPGTGTVEDDGADCQVATLPDATTANSKLPDPFKKLDGMRMTSKAEWRCRREELKKIAEKYVYGEKPPKPEMVSGTVTDKTITVKVTSGGKSTTFSASVALAGTGTGAAPGIIVYGGAGFGAPLDAAVVKGEGVALINYDPYAVGKEGTGRANKAGAFYDIYGSTSKAGLLVAWAWGVSRIIDVIEQSGGTILKPSIGVTGCSRFGKGSFVAGVFDQRVALTMPIESGSAGVPIFRGIPGEGAQSLSSAYGEQPWLGDGFSPFTSGATKLPFDTHQAVAMVAPRGLFIMDNPSIANLGPKSASVAALAGAEMYKALGAADNITYYSDVANGNHCSMRPEWSTPLKNAIQKFLTNKGGAPGVMKIASKASGNLADWKDWETPTLN